MELFLDPHTHIKTLLENYLACTNSNNYTCPSKKKALQTTSKAITIYRSVDLPSISFNNTVLKSELAMNG